MCPGEEDPIPASVGRKKFVPPVSPGVIHIPYFSISLGIECIRKGST